MVSSFDFGYNIGEVLSEYFDDLIFILNESFECEYINKSIHLEKLGYLSLKGKITDVVHHDDLQFGKVFLHNILKNGQAIENLRVRQKDTYKYYEFKGKSFKNKQQETKLLLTARDISLFELKYTDIVKNIGEAYFEVDLKGTFVFMNKSFTQMTGYSQNEMIGKNYKLLM
ncbi:MAG: PAS domain S-box protein, partial [Candidatus Lokiarchaeota archaeon]|nr:PAS domain S-box protein [Candidatus Lokiarchaeota archaeon]